VHYLVLGSSGQVGTALCEYYRARNHDVELFDIVESAAQDLKIYQNKLLKEKMSRCDFVFFLAFGLHGYLFSVIVRYITLFLSAIPHWHKRS